MARLGRSINRLSSGLRAVAGETFSKTLAVAGAPLLMTMYLVGRKGSKPAPIASASLGTVLVERRRVGGARSQPLIRQQPEAPGRRQRARRRHGRSTLPRSVLLGRSRRAGRGALRQRRRAPRQAPGADSRPAERVADGAAAATVRTIRAAIRAGHVDTGADDPTGHDGVRRVLQGLTRGPPSPPAPTISGAACKTL